MKKKYDVAAYIWPAYTGDEPRAHIFWNEKYGEWQSVKSAEKKFPEHTWPRRPLWGFVNEASPAIMEMEIEEALRYGVNVFAYDWYWFDRRPFLEQCLNNGFLKARNNKKMRFFIVWANHNADTFWDKRLSDEKGPMLWDGKVDRAEFERIVDRVITNYFSCENYYKIDGCPVFNIHFMQNLIKGLGGVEQTVEALEYFREQTKKAGFKDLHLQLNLVGQSKDYTGINLCYDINMAEALKKIRVDSATHYHWLAFTDMNRDYEDVIPDVVEEWENEQKNLPCTYYPQVSLGWDNNPRTHKLLPIICKNNTPDKIEKALLAAKKFIDEHNFSTPLVTINSWNEWTETSYLQPDDLYGYGYLEAVKRVFGAEDDE